jgi:hypothetical protein
MRRWLGERVGVLAYRRCKRRLEPELEAWLTHPERCADLPGGILRCAPTLLT